VGELPPPAVTVEASNPACGDLLRLSVRFEAGVAAEARYTVLGCAASIAAGSALSEWVRGKTREDLERFDAAVIDQVLGGLPPASKHAGAVIRCAATLSWSAPVERWAETYALARRVGRQRSVNARGSGETLGCAPWLRQ
jgi:nitrogen fixation NifU-like protein